MKLEKNKKVIDSREIIITAIIVSNNDEQVIENVLTNINEVLSENCQNYEILIVDNNSDDDTIGKIRGLHRQIPHLKIIRLSKKTTADIAYTAGLDNCIGDYAILLDIRAVSPKIIPSLVDLLIENFDIVIAKSRERTVPKWSLAGLFLSSVEKLSTHGFSYEPIHLLAVNRKAINSITRIRRKSRNLSYISHAIGFKKVIIEYTPIKGCKKTKAPNFIEILLIVTDIVISNSFKPIRILAAAGMIISMLFLVYVIFVVIAALIFNTFFAPKGWVTLASVIGAMFFLLFSLLTLISEYIIRILDESRNEPLYFISDEMDKSVININRDKLNVI